MLCQRVLTFYQDMCIRATGKPKAEGTKAEGTKAEGTKAEGAKAEGNGHPSVSYNSLTILRRIRLRVLKPRGG